MVNGGSSSTWWVTVTVVHDDLIADKGLAITYDQDIESGDCLLLR